MLDSKKQRKTTASGQVKADAPPEMWQQWKLQETEITELLQACLVKPLLVKHGDHMQKTEHNCK